MRIPWKKFASNIPNHIKVGKVEYEVLWANDLVSGQNYGETRFESKQIVLKADMGPKLKVETFFHEYLHAIGFEYGVDLPEKTVLDMERTFPALLFFMKTLEGTN